MPRALLLVLLAVLLLPGARAEGVEGEVRFPRGLALEGEVEVSARQGVLDLAAAVEAGEALSLRYASAEGYVVTRTTTYHGADGTGVAFPLAADPRNDSFSLPAGTLENLTCGLQCRVALLAADDGLSTLSLSGVAGGPVLAATDARVYAVGAADEPAEDSFLYRVEPGWVVATGRAAPHRAALLLADATPSVAGDVVLFLADADADWRAGNDSGRLRATPVSRPVEGPGGVAFPASREESRAYVVLRLREAELLASPGADVHLATPAPVFSVSGLLRADEARGALFVGGRRVALDGERLEVEGVLQARGGARSSAPALLPASEPDLDASLSGDASRVVVGGRTVSVASSLAVSPATALVAGLSLAGLLAALLLLKTGGIPFYTRVTHASLLRNANRRRIYEVIRARPGATVAELSRETTLSEVVVRHHARMLVSHRYVTVRAAGKMRAHFVVDAQTDPGLIALGVALKDATRRRIAETLVDAGRPLTQGDIAEAARVSRRLVSYHLARLEAIALVEQDGRTPSTYRPSDALAGYFAMTGARAAPLAE